MADASGAADPLANDIEVEPRCGAGEEVYTEAASPLVKASDAFLVTGD